jgi:hypothetical protein
LGAKGLTPDTDQIVTVGATVWRRNVYPLFLERWNAMLREWPARAFHATDFYSGYEEFWRGTKERHAPERDALFARHTREIPIAIGRHSRHNLAVSFFPAEFTRMAPKGWITTYGDSMHVHAVQLLLVLLGYWAQEVGHKDGFVYFMERGDDDEALVVKAVRSMERNAATSDHIQLSDFLPIKKGTARGLETADFLAWHFNKHFVDRVSKGRPDDLRKDFQAFVNQAGEGRVAHATMTGDKLAKFFDVATSSAGVRAALDSASFVEPDGADV